MYPLTFEGRCDVVPVGMSMAVVSEMASGTWGDAVPIPILPFESMTIGRFVLVDMVTTFCVGLFCFMYNAG